MNTIRLKKFGRLAGEARKLGNTALYSEMLDSIDEEIELLKRKHPENFWNDKDPKYMAIVDMWRRDRLMRHANS